MLQNGLFFDNKVVQQGDTAEEISCWIKFE